jgi:hypothetical protein
VFEGRRSNKSRTEGFDLKDKKSHVCKALPLTPEIMNKLASIEEGELSLLQTIA